MSAGRKRSTRMPLPKVPGVHAQRAATLAAIGFGIVASFQVLLTIGVPVGPSA